jgi:HSP20 family protein
MSPWQMMRRMQEDMDRVFGQFFGGWDAESGTQGGQQTGLARWMPHMDVSETDREWTVEVDLPGVREDDIDITARDNYLIVRAEQREEQETPQGGQTNGGQTQEGQARSAQTTGGQSQGTQPQGQQSPQRQYHFRERRYGYFERALRLPDNVDENQIRCEFRNGVLMIHLPKTEQARQQGRRIPISGGAQTGQGPGNGRGQQQREPAMAGTRGGEASSAEATQPNTAQPSTAKKP